MPFWTYMLQCRDRTLYVGHTDDLDTRLAQHRQGTFGGYTAGKRPVSLVWSEEFPTRLEALAAERQIKGWRKEKKLALIRGDWDLISRLSRKKEEKGQKKERPSTGSGQTGEGSLLNSPTVRPALVEGRKFFLLPHSGQAKPVVHTVEAIVHRRGPCLSLRYILAADLTTILIPPPAPPERANGLWHHSCFELFVRPSDGQAYYEFNFAPSGQWAAYRLARYREGMGDAEIKPPSIGTCRRDGRLEVCVRLDLTCLEELPAGHSWKAGLSAIIEDRSHERSYWALAHPPGDPDFHHPACFALDLPPADAP